MSGGIGAPARRPDAPAKAAGTFTYAGDLRRDGMLHGATLRSPHPRARLVSLDTAPALALPDVVGVVTARDVPGWPTYGLEHADQPVFVRDVAEHHGAPVAAVAATTAEAARAGVRAIAAVWEPLPAVTDPEEALQPTPEHPDGRHFRWSVVERGDREVEGPVVVEGDYDIGVQDHAFLGPEAALAVPDPDGGVTVHVATQWLHSDQGQVASCLGLTTDKVRMVLAGVGGAFGGREDVTLQVHVALLALHTGSPVRMVYTREDSFLGHPHRHAVRMHYRHTASPDGLLVSVRARLVFDGGAYASSSAAVIGNAVTMGAGPYVVPHVRIEGVAARTNNPPNGAMRGFGVVQTCAGHEAQMDRLAAVLGLDPVELRRRNAVGSGDLLATGQPLHGAVPVRELLDAVEALPLPPPATAADDPLLLPGGTGGCADPARVRRGTGYALGLKNLAFSEGYDDPSTARVRLELDDDGAPRAVVHSACAEVGQGFVVLAEQIARTELGVERVQLLPADTTIASAGSTSASRQSWVSGGAVQLAARAVAEILALRVANELGVCPEECRLTDAAVVHPGGRTPLCEVLHAGAIEAERTFRHRPTTPLDGQGQGEAHVAWAFVVHRAVVDVDLDLGTVRLVQLATVQDVGRALNPLALLGQLEGGAAQGVGLALMEELVLHDGVAADPSFEGYKIPTALDLPTLVWDVVEQQEPEAPYGAKGVGEPPTVTSPAAVMAALRHATGLPLTRLPVRAEHLVQP